MVDGNIRLHRACGRPFDPRQTDVTFLWRRLCWQLKLWNFLGYKWIRNFFWFFGGGFVCSWHSFLLRRTVSTPRGLVYHHRHCLQVLAGLFGLDCLSRTPCRWSLLIYMRSSSGGSVNLTVQIHVSAAYYIDQSPGFVTGVLPGRVGSSLFEKGALKVKKKRQNMGYLALYR